MFLEDRFFLGAKKVMTLNSRLKPMKNKAFTLIELLVVIAIIALLLSILMPALNKVKDQGKTVVCASHLKQWGIILSFYTADNGDRFPSGEEGSRGQWWFLPLRSYYVEQENILICGKAKIKKIDSPLIAVFGNGRYFPQKHDEAWGREIISSGHPDNGEWVWSSYGPNAWLMNPILPNGNVQRWGSSVLPVPNSSFWGKFINISTPSQVPFYLDSRHVDSWPHDTDIPADYEFPADSPTDDIGGQGSMRVFTMLRHNKGINIVFGDGSVRRVGLQELWGIKWHRTFNTNNDYATGKKLLKPWMR